MDRHLAIKRHERLRLLWAPRLWLLHACYRPQLFWLEVPQLFFRLVCFGACVHVGVCARAWAFGLYFAGRAAAQLLIVCLAFVLRAWRRTKKV